MKIEIRPTSEIELVNGTHCRLWKGHTESGIECDLFIALVKVRKLDDNAEFERELNEVKSDRQLSYFDNRLVLP